MFTYAFDAKSGTAVFLFSGPYNTDDDFERYLAAVEQLDKIANARTDTAMVALVDKGNPPPNARWRGRIGEISKGLRTHTVHALVSDSPAVRGVMTVLNWFAPKRFEAQAVLSTWDEALEWVESMRKGRRTVLTVLLREARADAERRAARW